MTDSRIGAVIQGRYRIVEPLAAGAMGLVYRGERLALGRPVAIKFMHAAIAADPAVLARFEGEARAASRMNHPNVVGVIDCGSHRDLKPENILVWSDELGEHAQITDFGLAKRLDAVGVSQNLAIGTPSYMSPEQTLGVPVDARSDLYSAGILLFELLADRKPFHSPYMFETLRMQREAPLPWFGDLAPEREIPPELEGVVRRALAKEPSGRYRSAGDFAVALDDAMVSAHEHSDIDVALLLAASKPRRRWRYLAVAAALVGVAYLSRMKLYEAAAGLRGLSDTARHEEHRDQDP